MDRNRELVPDKKRKNFKHIKKKKIKKHAIITKHNMSIFRVILFF